MRRSDQFDFNIQATIEALNHKNISKKVPTIGLRFGEPIQEKLTKSIDVTQQITQK